ncbi:MAG: ribbon-helix-helix protein, CopG family [Chloroflexota bacterium]
MNRTAKVAISLPGDILKAVEEERKARGESRSAFFRRAAERLLSQERRSSAVSDYIHGYQQMPESAAEVEALHRIGGAVLGEEPWA